MALRLIIFTSMIFASGFFPDAALSQSQSSKSATQRSTSKRTVSKKTAAKKAAVKDWPLIVCGKDLKATAGSIDAYQKKLAKAGKAMSLAQRQALYSGTSVLAESMTLLSPEVFWDDMLATRVTKGCHNKFKALKHGMKTNDSKGTPARLQDWNTCVLAQYGSYPKQTRQINACIKSGLAYIKQRQK